ncbi:hypothetical protein PoB_001208300, partial [Plakobranchus ocellatus]
VYSRRRLTKAEEIIVLLQALARFHTPASCPSPTPHFFLVLVGRVGLLIGTAKAIELLFLCFGDGGRRD